jgi:hypothetical protein
MQPVNKTSERIICIMEIDGPGRRADRAVISFCS